MNLEMHLHLNSELASNEFLTEFALKICIQNKKDTVGICFSETV